MILTGTLRDIAGADTDGTISILSRVTRESVDNPGELITREIHREPIEDGRFRIEGLEAGPVTIELTAGNEYSRWDINLPDDDAEHDIAGLVELQVEWEPPIVGAAQAAAAEAMAAAETVGGAEAVMSAKSEAEAAASSSASSATDAASSATNAVDSAASAAQSARDAAQSARDAAQSAQDAAGSATNAGDFASVATTAAAEAVDAMDAAARSAAAFSIYTGTGSPEGRVTAPVGAVYTDSAATAGAVRWIKTSGTGNTGWQVEYGDTGWRALPRPEMFSGGGFKLSRNGNYVHAIIHAATLASNLPAGQEFITFPPGFRTASAFRVPAQDAYLDVRSNGGIAQIATNLSAGNIVSFGAVYRTSDPWPTTLPGYPA